MITLTPAYGRDYRSKAQIQADFDAGKDFIVNEYGNRYDGKPANRESLVQAGVKAVNVRYARLTKVAVLKVN